MVKVLQTLFAKISLCLIVVLLLLCTSFFNRKSFTKGYLMYTIRPDVKFDSSGNRLYFTNYDSLYSKVFYVKDYVLVVQNYRWRSLTLRDNPDSVPFVSKEKVVVYKLNSKSGVLHDEPNGKLYIISVDSFLTQAKVFDSDERIKLYKQRDYMLISSNSNDEYIDNIYSVTARHDTAMKGLFKVKYFKGNDFNSPIYLNKYLEDSVGYRIPEMTFTTFARRVPPTNTFVDRIEVYRRIKEVSEDVSQYFEKCKIPIPEK